MEVLRKRLLQPVVAQSLYGMLLPLLFDTGISSLILLKFGTECTKTDKKLFLCKNLDRLPNWDHLL